MEHVTIVTSRSTRLEASWKILCSIIPGFKQEMIVVAEQHLLWHSVCLQVSQDCTGQLDCNQGLTLTLDRLIEALKVLARTIPQASSNRYYDTSTVTHLDLFNHSFSQRVSRLSVAGTILSLLIY